MAQPAHGPLRTERTVTKPHVCLPLRASRISGRCLPPCKIVTIRNWRCSAPGARDPPLGTALRSPAMPGGAAPNWVFRAVAGRCVRAIGCCSAGIVIVVPVLCCSFTAQAGGVTLDR